MEINEKWKKNTVLFLSSQAVSLFGSMLVQYAITWYITLKTQSGASMTIAIICGFLPTFFVSPFAGVWADRYSRKMLIALADSMIAIATLLMAIFFLMGYDSIWMLFVVLSIRAFGSGIQTPCIGAMLPQLVPQDNLTKVNAVNSSIQSLIMLVSPMLSGGLLTLASIEIIFFIDVITAAIAVFVLLFLLKVPLHLRALSKQESGYFTDMHEGIRYIKNHDFVKRFFIFNAVFLIMVVPVAFLTPLQVTRTFGDDVWRLTFTEMSFSIGMMLGGILMAYWGGFKNKVHSMGLSNIIIGFGTLALGLIPNFWVYLFFMSMIGLSMPIFNTPATVLLQQKVEGDYLGRVFGVLSMISSSMMPLGMIVFGPVADYVRIEWLLIGTGFMILLQSLFMLNDKVLIEAGKPVSQE